MNEITLNNLLEKINNYSTKDINQVKKAYEYAALSHEGQYRQSGEPYIIHPLNVAYILSELYAS